MDTKSDYGEKIIIKEKIEHVSFESYGEYMDIEVHLGYVDISIGGIENHKFSVDLEGWEKINSRVIDLLNQK